MFSGAPDCNPCCDPGVGIGLRARHYRDFSEGQPAVACLEVHAENYFTRGGTAHELLLQLAERYPIGVHGVALSLASADGVDDEHLRRFAALVDDVRPLLVSEHLAWSRFGTTYFNDLLPLPLTGESFAIVRDNVRRVQDYLGRRILVENPSAYLRFESSTMSEAEFLARLVEDTACGVLLDVNNLHVSAHNLGFDPLAYLTALPAAAVGEIHLAGHEPSQRVGEHLLIDTHSQPVAPAVWALYAETVARLGARPTVIEWDTNLPPLAVLLDQAARAAAHLRQVPGSHELVA